MDEVKIRQVLYSLLKPGLIVDGQHRVYGAADANEQIQLSVCALPGTEWLEQVYQFVLINQKAKPIKPAFLNSIIATSLSADEINTLYDRLNSAGVDIDKAQLMYKVNTDERSPFKGMIDFEVEDAPGFLQFPGMYRLVLDFKKVARTHSILVSGILDWENVDVWLPQFFAMWSGVKEHFEVADERLWIEPSESNPNNLLKIVTLQELQQMMFDIWADARDFRLQDEGETKAKAKAFWTGFPTTFFSDEWKKKGLQTSVGRRLLHRAMNDTRRNFDRRNWGHRRLSLFQED